VVGKLADFEMVDQGVQNLHYSIVVAILLSCAMVAPPI